jgi:hypothetical protein
MSIKLNLTKELVKILAFDNELNIDELYSEIWRNLRHDGGFRLTNKGYELFSEYLELEHYTVDLNVPSLSIKMLLDLDHKLKHPYYLHIYKHNVDLILFDSKEAMLANLYGDMKKFLDNYT